MKLPWVSRETYDGLVERYDRLRSAAVIADIHIIDLSIQLAEARTELRMLKSPPVSTTIAPDVPSALATVPLAVAPVESSDEKRIRKAINENALQGGKINVALQGHLRTYATALRRQDYKTDEIEKKLSTWTTSEPSD